MTLFKYFKFILRYILVNYNYGYLDLFEYKELKTKNNMEFFLHSLIYINCDDSIYNIKIYPDACDYIMFSSHRYYSIFRKHVRVQTISISDENIILFRLKPYTLKLIEDNNELYFEKLYLLQENLFSTKSIFRQLAFFNFFLLEDLFDIFIKYELEVTICDEIYNSKSDIKLSNFEKRFNVSSRTIQRKFKELIQISPKEYLDIIRFQYDIIKINFIKFKRHKNLPTWAVDYSHYYKFFSKFTNSSPKKFF